VELILGVCKVWVRVAVRVGVRVEVEMAHLGSSPGWKLVISGSLRGSSESSTGIG
jgi:hypothetical protein